MKEAKIKDANASDFLSRKFNWKNQDLVSVYDDLPLWSATPGQLLLQHIQYVKHQTVLDIGCGTGFPLIPMAERFGPTCQLYGLDSWDEALNIAQKKINQRSLKNVRLIRSTADNTGLASESISVITSNLGINNFNRPRMTLRECSRVLKSDGKLYLSTNTRETFPEFYDVFIDVLNELGNPLYSDVLNDHINARFTEENLNEMFALNGFALVNSQSTSTWFNYADGSAFFNDYFIAMAFLPAWKAIVGEEDRQFVFNTLERRLNKIAHEQGMFKTHVNSTVYCLEKVANASFH